ncbi:MAG: hypothetical protein ACK6A8_18635, partial [Planctomycetota bacterium]
SGPLPQFFHVCRRNLSHLQNLRQIPSLILNVFDFKDCRDHCRPAGEVPCSGSKAVPALPGRLP